MSSLSNGSIKVSRFGGYSAKVRLFLRQNGEQVDLGQVGPEAMYFDLPIRLPAGHAELVVEIDGEPRRTAIVIPEQAAPSRVIPYAVA